MIAALVAVLDAALEMGDRGCKHRQLIPALFRFAVLQPTFALACKTLGKRAVFVAQNVHAEMAGAHENGESIRPAVEAPQHQGRFQGHRGERVHGQTHRRAIGLAAGHHRDTCRKMTQRVAKAAGMLAHLPSPFLKASTPP